MTTLKILIEGYATEQEYGWRVHSTTVLIRSNGKLIVVDPGFDREKLLNELNREKLTPDDIDFVFLTHGHIDHSLLAGIFENAMVIDELYMYQKDIIKVHNGLIPGTEVKIIRTPGHKEEHCSLIVPTKEGVYAIAGDVFWWTTNQKQVVSIESDDNDPEHMNKEELIQSRKKLIEIADYIIPGHGNMIYTKAIK